MEVLSKFSRSKFNWNLIFITFPKGIIKVSPPSIGDDFLSAMNQQQLSDVQFLVGPDGTEIYSHRVILAARSSKFKSMFDPALSTQKITLDFDAKIFLQLLEFVYSGIIKIPEPTSNDHQSFKKLFNEFGFEYIFKGPNGESNKNTKFHSINF
jgi:hypothetical protein